MQCDDDRACDHQQEDDGSHPLDLATQIVGQGPEEKANDMAAGGHRKSAKHIVGADDGRLLIIDPGPPAPFVINLAEDSENGGDWIARDSSLHHFHLIPG